MTKDQLIDLIQDACSGGDMPQEMKGRFHDEIVSAHIALVLNDVIANEYKIAEKKRDWSALDVYVNTYIVAILTDEARDEKYSILPVEPINLPKNRGIRQISPKKDQQHAFIYRDNNSKRFFGNLDVNDVIATARWYRENKNVFYSEHISPFQEEVLMKIIPSFDELGYDDQINFPGELNVVEMVKNSLLGKPPEKVSNDNNANIP